MERELFRWWCQFVFGFGESGRAGFENTLDEVNTSAAFLVSFAHFASALYYLILKPNRNETTYFILKQVNAALASSAGPWFLPPSATAEEVVPSTADGFSLVDLTYVPREQLKYFHPSTVYQAPYVGTICSCFGVFLHSKASFVCA